MPGSEFSRENDTVLGEESKTILKILLRKKKQAFIFLYESSKIYYLV